jgi:hypothetical protein
LERKKKLKSAVGILNNNNVYAGRKVNEYLSLEKKINRTRHVSELYIYRSGARLGVEYTTLAVVFIT